MNAFIDSGHTENKGGQQTDKQTDRQTDKQSDCNNLALQD